MGEHVPVVGRGGVLGRVPEGEHVEGLGRCTVEHGDHYSRPPPPPRALLMKRWVTTGFCHWWGLGLHLRCSCGCSAVCGGLLSTGRSARLHGGGVAVGCGGPSAAPWPWPPLWAVRGRSGWPQTAGLRRGAPGRPAPPARKTGWPQWVVEWPLGTAAPHRLAPPCQSVGRGWGGCQASEAGAQARQGPEGGGGRQPPLRLAQDEWWVGRGAIGGTAAPPPGSEQAVANRCGQAVHSNRHHHTGGLGTLGHQNMHHTRVDKEPLLENYVLFH